jgi:hypothetical protein
LHRRLCEGALAGGGTTCGGKVSYVQGPGARGLGNPTSALRASATADRHPPAEDTLSIGPCWASPDWENRCSMGILLIKTPITCEIPRSTAVGGAQRRDDKMHRQHTRCGALSSRLRGNPCTVTTTGALLKQRPKRKPRNQLYILRPKRQ